MSGSKEDLNENLAVPESYQKYLDAIYAIARKHRGGWVTNKEIAESLHVEPASVTGMLEKLSENDLINWEPRKSIRLTRKGKKIGKNLTKIHELLSKFFEKVLKIKDKDLIEKLSCEIEHHITSEVRSSLEKFLTEYERHS